MKIFLESERIFASGSLKFNINELLNFFLSKKCDQDLRDVSIQPSSKSYSTIPYEKRNNVTNIYECINICIFENKHTKGCFYNDKEGYCLTLFGNDYILSSNMNNKKQSIYIFLH